MQNGKFNIHFFIRNPNRKGRGLVHIRFTYQRKKADTSIGELVCSSDWDARKGRAKKDSQLNYHLDKLYDFLVEARREMIRNEELISVSTLKEKLLTKHGVTNSNDPLNLLKYFRNHIEMIKEMPQDYCIGTIKQYKTTYKCLEEYLTKRVGTELQINKVDYKVISGFDEFMKAKTPRLISATIRSRHSKFRAVLYDCIRRNCLQEIPTFNSN